MPLIPAKMSWLVPTKGSQASGAATELIQRVVWVADR